MSTETERDPVGFLGTRAFLFGLHDLPSVPKGRFKQLLIREGRGCRDKGEAVKKQQGCLGAGSWLLLKRYI